MSRTNLKTAMKNKVYERIHRRIIDFNLENNMQVVEIFVHPVDLKYLQIDSGAELNFWNGYIKLQQRVTIRGDPDVKREGVVITSIAEI